MGCATLRACKALLLLVETFVAVLSVAIRIAPVTDPEAEGEKKHSQQALHDYLSIRDDCVWEASSWNRCGMKVSTCKINATYPEGSGYYFIARFGPITTHGGVEDVKCAYLSHSPEVGSWMTRALTAPIDPFTGDLIGFPPMHIHHSVFINMPHPPTPTNILNHMPWLNIGELPTASLGKGANAADSECSPAYGGTSCLAFVYPEGYGRRCYEKHDRHVFQWHLQDVRQPHSPPMTVFMESAQFYVMQQDQQKPPLKTLFDLGLAVGGGPPLDTYDLPYNASVYQFVTYYFSMSIDIVATYFHTHSVHGDEGWLVRGTQQDLGIPKELQQPVRTGVDRKGAISLGITVPKGKSLESIKYSMESSIEAAARAYDRAHNLHDRDSIHRHEKQRLADEGFAFRPFNEQLHQQQQQQIGNATLLPARPKILCKWHTANSEVTLEDLRERKQQWYNARNELARTGNTKRPIFAPNTAATAEKRKEEKGESLLLSPTEEQISASDPIHHPHAVDNSVFIPRKEVLRPVNTTAVTAAEQGNNIFSGVKPGQYYRRFRSTAQAGMYHDARFSECERLFIRAGEYVTVVHFNGPRLSPSSSQRYDHTVNTMHQHTFFVAQGHVRGYPYY